MNEPRKPGRPKGSKQKNFLTLQYWFNQLQADLAEMKPAQRASIAQKMMQTLMTHDQHLQEGVRAERENLSTEDDLLASLNEK